MALATSDYSTDVDGLEQLFTSGTNQRVIAMPLDGSGPATDLVSSVDLVGVDDPMRGVNAYSEIIWTTLGRPQRAW